MKKDLGVTLLELLTALAIISIALLAGVPAYRSLVLHNQNQTNINRFIGAFNFARTQAILKKHSTFVCPNTHSIASEDGVSNCGSDWSQGIIIYDQKGIIKIIDPFKHSVINWNRQQNLIQFLANGKIKGQNGTFIYYNKQNQLDSRRSIVISMTGRIRLI